MSIFGKGRSLLFLYGGVTNFLTKFGSAKIYEYWVVYIKNHLYYNVRGLLALIMQNMPTNTDLHWVYFSTD